MLSCQVNDCLSTKCFRKIQIVVTAKVFLEAEIGIFYQEIDHEFNSH